jgi:hypothetical protein
VRWSWQGAECRVETPSGRAVLAQHARAASGNAELGSVPGSLEALLTGVAAALSYRRGGAVLHAAGVELEGGVVAFIGPSGAGKSTAARQLASARLFAVDRMALEPRGAGWLACSLPGGTSEPHDGVRSTELVLPLCAVLRVRQSPRGAEVVAVSRGKALALLRAAVFQGTRDPADEARLLESLESLASSVPLGELHFGLGSELEPVLAAWSSWSGVR